MLADGLESIYKFKVKTSRLKSEKKIKKFLLEIESDIKEGHYIYADKLKFDLKAESTPRVIDRLFPEPIQHFDGFLEKETGIYRRKNSFKLIFTLSDPKNNSSTPTKLEITYRGCSKTICYPAKTEIIKLDLYPTENLPIKPSLMDKWLSKGFLLALLASFLAGIISSLTPCVYPIIPVVIALIAAKPKRSNGFFLSSSFTIGLAIVYSAFGLLAGKSGMFMGSLMQSAFLISFVSLVFLAMGLSLIGLYELRLPHKITGRLSSIKGQGLLGALLTGMVTAIIAVPCVGPFAASVLALAAKTESLIKGFLLLSSFSLGMGILFVALGTFSSLALKLPKPGPWMVTLKKISGTLLVLVSLYFISFALPSSLLPLLIFITLVVISVAFKIISKKEPETGNTDAVISRVALILAAIVLLTSTFLVNLKTPSGKNYEHDKSINWISKEAQALDESQKTGKPVLADFYADWCANCGELERYTFKDIRIIGRESDFIFLKIDLSKDNIENNAVSQKYSVLGLPTLIFICPDGKEAVDSRVVGFMNSDKLLRHMDNVKEMGCLSKH